MTNLIEMARCQHTGCKVKASFGKEYRRPLYCVNHALDGMVRTGKSKGTREQFEEMLQQALVEGNACRADTQNRVSVFVILLKAVNCY